MNVWTNWILSIFTQSYYYIINRGGNRFDEIKHYEIMKKLRSCLELNYEELTFVKTLSKDQLIEIIEINNIYIERMNEVIRYNEK